MVAAPRLTQTSPSYTPPTAEPAPKGQDFTRIATIALPIIAALAGFVFLSPGNAIIMAAVITVGAIVYFNRQQTAPPVAKPNVIPNPEPKLPPHDSEPAVMRIPAPPFSLKATTIKFYDLSREGEPQDPVFSSIEFDSESKAIQFAAICKQRFSEHLSCQDAGLTKKKKLLFYNNTMDSKTRTRIEKEIRRLVG